MSNLTVACGELQRVLVPDPGNVEAYPEWIPPVVRWPGTERMQVTSHHDTFGNVLERWQYSDTDIRWYRVEKFINRWVTVRISEKKPVSK